MRLFSSLKGGHPAGRQVNVFLQLPEGESRSPQGDWTPLGHSLVRREILYLQVNNRPLNLQDPVTWYERNDTGIDCKLRGGTFKTNESRAGLVQVPLFWKSHCVTCVPG